MTTQAPAPNALARCGTYEKPETASAALVAIAREYPLVCPGGTPQVNAIAEGYSVSVTNIRPVEGDTFKDRSSGAICFHADFLRRLAKGLGLAWLPQETRRLDDMKDSFLCSMIVAGQYRDYAGELVTVTGTHMLDLRDGAEHGKTPAELKRARKSIQQLCETMAKSRAIADACVSRTMNPADMDKPIVMAKVFRIAPIDPDQAKAALYGPTKAASPAPAGDGIESAKRAEVIDQHTGEVTQAPAPERPESSAKLTITTGKGYAGEGKTFAEASDDELLACHDAMKAKLAAEGAKWTAAGCEGAKRKIAAASAELDWRMEMAKRMPAPAAASEEV